MILCITQPIEEYGYKHELGVKVGIGEIYEENPALFSMLSIMSPILYQWEAGSPVPFNERAARLDDHLMRLYSDSLFYVVEGKLMSQWLSALDTPTSLYFHLDQFSLAGFPLLQFYDRGQLNLVMRARCYSWLQQGRQQGRQPEDKQSTLFCKDEEIIAKENAYGKYNVPQVH